MCDEIGCVNAVELRDRVCRFVFVTNHIPVYAMYVFMHVYTMVPVTAIPEWMTT